MSSGGRMSDRRDPRRVDSHVVHCREGAVQAWARLARDHNPLHLDPEFAAQTQFGVPIVHGHLLASLVIDRVQMYMGDRPMPKVSIRFKAPVPVGSELLVDVRSIGDSGVIEVVTFCGDYAPLDVHIERASAG